MKKFSINYIESIFDNLINICKINDNELPVASCLLDQNGNIIEYSINQNLKHAEMIIIDKYYNLSGYSLCVTLQPCICCLINILNKKINYIFFGAKNNLYNESIKKILMKLNIFYQTKWFGGFKEIEINNLLKQFFQSKRKINDLLR